MIGHVAKTAKTLAMLAIAGVASACGSLGPSPDPSPSARAMEMGASEIAVVERGWHTDIVVPAPIMTGAAGPLRQAFPGAPLLAFGFGDRAYLMARKVTAGNMVRAIFPGAGVILITGLNAPPDQAFPGDEVVVLRLSCAQLGALAIFLEQRLGGAPKQLGDGPYPGSLFYATPDVYDLLYNCNRWTVEALRRAGFAADQQGVVTAGQVMALVRSLAAQQYIAGYSGPARDTSAPRGASLTSCFS